MGRRSTFAAVAAGLIAAGLIWRLALLGLPFFFYKYGGSAIWGAMVYCVVAALFPSRRPVDIALIAAAVAILSELFRLYHTPGLDAFRATLFGALLLGRTFLIWNIVAYLVAIAAATGIDRFFSRLSRP
jgi:Protein of unknown function (DUF2809)